VRRVLWEPRARKSLARLDERTGRLIVTAMQAFAETGRGDVVKLKGKLTGKYRLRVGKWRAMYRVDGDLIRVIDVDDRGTAYR